MAKLGRWLASALLLLVAPPMAWNVRGDARSHELLKLRCNNERGHSEVTLFANGTVRRRHKASPDSETVMNLAELRPDELDGYVARLAGEDLSEADPPRSGPSGELVEQCELTLELERGTSVPYRFRRMDSLPLTLSRVVGIADELSLVAEERDSSSGFPHGYEPKIGDLVRRADDVVFEVVGFTSDDRGIELTGVEQPLTIFVARADFVQAFVELVDPVGG